MSTQDALDRACDDFAAGRVLDDAGRRLLLRAAQSFAETPSRQRDAMLRQEDIRKRDHILCDLATGHCGGLKGVRPKANQIAAWARRYEGCGWKRDKYAATCPDHITGRPEGLIWQALKAHPSFPRDRQLREIIARSTV